MNKFCCYLLIIVFLLFTVFFLEYLKLRDQNSRELNNRKAENPSQDNNAETTVKDKNLKLLLDKYLKDNNYRLADTTVILSTNRFVPDLKPLSGELVISQHFSEKHTGIDWAASYGEEVFAAGAGRILKNSFDDYFGNLIIIDHLNGYCSYYGHLDKSIVIKDYFVEKGAVIGFTGSTGFSTGTHLHYSISLDDKFLDPEHFWKK